MHFIYIYLYMYCVVLVRDLFRCCQYRIDISCVDTGWDENKSKLWSQWYISLHGNRLNNLICCILLLLMHIEKV